MEYLITTTNGELYHHGILGQKWGVRRYQNPDGSLTSAGRKRYSNPYTKKKEKSISKMNNAKTSFVKNYYNDKQRGYAINEDRFKNITRDIQKKDIKGFASDFLGYGAEASVRKANIDYYDNKSKYARTEFGRHVANVNKFNSEADLKAVELLRSSTSLDSYVQNLVKVHSEIPIKTIAGRTTTTGKEFVANMLTGGLYSVASDTAYLINKNRNKES